MSRLRTLLAQQYAQHYARVNVEIRSSTLPPHMLKGMQKMYGDLVSELSPESRVLDLGCGTGFLLHWLSGQSGIIPVGVDSSVTQVEIARQNLPGVDIACGDGLSYLQRHPNTFVGIFCMDVLEHIPGEDLCLEWVETARAALQPDGFFCCRVPNAANLTGNYGRYMDLTHARIFTATSLLQLLEAAGLQECRVIPIRVSRLTGRLRLAVEWLLHKAIFRICGRGLENVFTSNVCAVGFRQDHERG